MAGRSRKPTKPGTTLNLSLSNLVTVPALVMTMENLVELDLGYNTLSHLPGALAAPPTYDSSDLATTSSGARLFVCSTT
jgi:Leucine-rich repeat (LRR) protein